MLRLLYFTLLYCLLYDDSVYRASIARRAVKSSESDRPLLALYLHDGARWQFMTSVETAALTDLHAHAVR